jgi:hypothetical protein
MTGPDKTRFTVSLRSEKRCRRGESREDTDLPRCLGRRCARRRKRGWPAESERGARRTKRSELFKICACKPKRKEETYVGDSRGDDETSLVALSLGSLENGSNGRSVVGNGDTTVVGLGGAEGARREESRIGSAKLNLA